MKNNIYTFKYFISKNIAIYLNNRPIALIDTYNYTIEDIDYQLNAHLYNINIKEFDLINKGILTPLTCKLNNLDYERIIKCIQ